MFSPLGRGLDPIDRVSLCPGAPCEADTSGYVSKRILAGSMRVATGTQAGVDKRLYS